MTSSNSPFGVKLLSVQLAMFSEKYSMVSYGGAIQIKHSLNSKLDVCKYCKSIQLEETVKIQLKQSRTNHHLFSLTATLIARVFCLYA
jgi:hypothetical protein